MQAPPGPHSRDKANNTKAKRGKAGLSLRISGSNNKEYNDNKHKMTKDKVISINCFAGKGKSHTHTHISYLVCHRV